MENKKIKNILLGVGMGAVLCSSALFTGCSEIPVTEEQINKVVEFVDNSGDYMEDMTNITRDYNTLLENHTAQMAGLQDNYNKLQEEYNELQQENNTIQKEYNDLLEKESKKRTKTELFNLMKLAVQKVLFNSNNCWDNLSIRAVLTLTEADGENIIEQNLLKTTDGTRLFIVKQSTGSEPSINDIQSVLTNEYTEPSPSNSFTYMVRQSLTGGIPVLSSEDDIVNSTIGSDGNYHIVAFTQIAIMELGQMHDAIIEYVIAEDGTLLQLVIDSTMVQVSETYYSLGRMVYNFCYNSLDEETVVAEWEEYKANQSA